MSSTNYLLPEAIYDYAMARSLREPPLLAELREETAKDPLSRMQIAPEQGQLMALLVRLMGARRALEIGVFTGYSALSVALALPDDGELIACDVSEEWTRVARRYWERAGVAGKIDLRLRPALETLDALLEAGEADGFDFAFVDADKSNYVNYYERLLRLVRPGGLIAFDNVFWGGRVVDDSDQSTDTVAIRALNDALRDDDRIELSILPVADGLTLARRR